MSSNSPSLIKLPVDPVIERYKQDVDKTLLRENLKLTVEQRLQQHRRVAKLAAALREAGRK
jgi:hypothetical protein